MRSGRQLKGSSPLTRGKRGDAQEQVLGAGLIPAHAGKTNLRYASRAMYRAHPRSRGENVEGAPGWQIIHGLIPAHAGKTTSTA